MEGANAGLSPPGLLPKCTNSINAEHTTTHPQLESSHFITDYHATCPTLVNTGISFQCNYLKVQLNIYAEYQSVAQ